MAVADRTSRAGSRVRARLVHAYTATGVVLAFVAATEIAGTEPRVVRIFLLLAAAVLIDATDGILARRWEVKRWTPAIDGRTIDDIVDYLTYTFLPLLLMWRMGWLPDPALLWILPALVASLFGFANAGAKDEAGGFFLGFPSYWNVVAFYGGILHHLLGPWPNAVVLLALAALTLAPVRFVYPNLAPGPWRVALTGGGLVWLGLFALMLPAYPAPRAVLVWVSLAFPAFYVVASARMARRMGGRGAGGGS